jgi:hypothetical protein
MNANEIVDLASDRPRCGTIVRDDEALRCRLAYAPESQIQRCDPYPESEVPVEVDDDWLFFRRDPADVNPVS